MTTRLTKNFTLEELVHSDTAAARGIPNVPDTGQRLCLERLANYLQLVRNRVGRAVHISSGFRGDELNRAVGGAARSFHRKGLAADLQVRGMTNQELARICASTGLPDLVIEEQLDGRIWTHVQVEVQGVAPRGKCLLARKRGGRTVYLPCGPDFEEE